MGIKDLTKFIKERNINCFIENYPLSNLKGYRIGIDTNNFLFYYGASIHKDAVYKTVNVEENGVDREALLQKMYQKTLEFSIIMMNNGVTPIFVFDGNAEKEKTEERQKRQDDRQKRKERMIEIKTQMDLVPFWLRNPKSLSDVPKDKWDEAIKYKELEEEYKKLMSTMVFVPRDEMEAIQSLLGNLGIPYIIADNEGEMMCAELALAQHTAATFSTDSDCMALGIPFYFSNINKTKKGKGGVLSGTTLQPILDDLKFNMSEFRDFCILLGTDFNKRIPGYGPAKGYKLLEECRTIENIASIKNLDITPLNHIRTRELITPKVRDWGSINLDIKFDIFESNLKTVLEQYMISDMYENLNEAFQYVRNVRYGLC